MQAIINKEYSKGFLLNEEHLIKLDDICKKRFRDIGVEQSLSYKVYRSDSLVFDSDNYQTVLDEENSKRNMIEKVRITSTSEVLKYALSFDNEEGVSLSVEAESKDTAYLLFSDIKEYLTTEILCFRSFNFNKILSHKNTFPFLFILIMITMTFAISAISPTSQEIQILLDTGSVDEKLNFLIEARKRQNSPEGIYPLFGGGMAVFALLIFVGPALDRVFPMNIFCWGKMASNYTKLTSLRGKIVWGVLIAFIISAAAGLFINYMEAI